jgi:hypothetical protein
LSIPFVDVIICLSKCVKSLLPGPFLESPQALLKVWSILDSAFRAKETIKLELDPPKPTK